MKKRFCPTFYPKKLRIKDRLRKSKQYDFLFVKWRTDSRFDKDILVKIFGQLHYLGSHSYVTNKWHNAEMKLLKQHPNRF